MPLKGARAHVKRLRALASPAMADEVEKVLFHAGELIQTEAQISITRGAVSGKNHVPSAPGQPPNQDTGVLAGNIETTRAGKLRVRVTSKAGYSSALEFGSSREAGTTSRSFAGKTTPYGPNKAKHGPVKVEFGDSTTAARPFMRPARDKMRPQIEKLLADAVNKQVKASKRSD